MIKVPELEVALADYGAAIDEWYAQILENKPTEAAVAKVERTELICQIATQVRRRYEKEIV